MPEQAPPAQDPPPSLLSRIHPAILIAIGVAIGWGLHWGYIEFQRRLIESAAEEIVSHQQFAWPGPSTPSAFQARPSLTPPQSLPPSPREALAPSSEPQARAPSRNSVVDSPPAVPPAIMSPQAMLASPQSLQSALSSLATSLNDPQVKRHLSQQQQQSLRDLVQLGSQFQPGKIQTPAQAQATSQHLQAIMQQFFSTIPSGIMPQPASPQPQQPGQSH